jgi:hypothetical protein
LYCPGVANVTCGLDAFEFCAPPPKFQLYESAMPFWPVTVALNVTAPPAGTVVRDADTVTVSSGPSNTSIAIGCG